MSDKTRLIKPEDIKSLAPNYGACIATDMITVHGHKVGYMYREEPDTQEDSGWRFLSGTETQEYLDDPENLDLYDVNTIANYDSKIVPYLEAPVGSAFERTADSDEFVNTQFPEEEADE